MLPIGMFGDLLQAEGSLPGNPLAVDPRLVDEAGRQSALDRYSLADPPCDAAFDAIVEMVRTVCDVPSAAISLIDSERQWFLARAGLDAGELPRQFAFCSHTIGSREAMIVPDARNDMRFRDNPVVTNAPHIVSYAGVPLETPDGYNLGALCAIDYRLREFAAAQIEALRKLAAMVVDQLEWRQLQQRDPLTKALSRRAFIAAADNLIWQRDWCSLPASLLVFDIDDFKVLNSRHGHAAGDTVLRKLARHKLGIEPEFDVLARIGGDRFALLRVGEVGSRALEIADTMRNAIAAMRFPELPGVAVTASFGISELDADTHDAAAWLADAETWLAAAKRAGGDRCQQVVPACGLQTGQASL